MTNQLSSGKFGAWLSFKCQLRHNAMRRFQFTGTRRTLQMDTPNGHFFWPISRVHFAHFSIPEWHSGNTAKAILVDFVTRKVAVEASFKVASFGGPFGKRRTHPSKDTDPELGHNLGKETFRPPPQSTTSWRGRERKLVYHLNYVFT